MTEVLPCIYDDVLDEMEPGETRKINHDDCAAGVDERRRLYLTRPVADPTVVLGYCHNCQTGYIRKTYKYEPFRDDKYDMHIPYTTYGQCESYKDKSELDVLKEQYDKYVWDTQEWPSHALGWAVMNFNSVRLITNLGLRYDPTTDRVALPQYATTKNVHVPKRNTPMFGFQLRKLHGSGPKYITYSSPEARGSSLLIGVDSKDIHTLVLVEDLASGAVAASTVSGVGALVLYGTNANISGLSYAKYRLPNLRRVLVWLDNDGLHIIDRAKALHKLNTLVFDTDEVKCDLELTHIEPKKVGESVLKDVLMKAEVEGL